MKIKWYKGFLSLLFSLSLFFACNTGSGVDNNITPTPSVEKLKITFDAFNAECKQGEEVFISGSEIEEGKELKFTAKIIEGESIKCWYVNNNKKESETKKEFVYKVVATDADSNKVINISYVSNTLKLTFDASQIKCKKGYLGSGEEVASGVKVVEGEDYQFTAVGLGEDEIVDAWYVGKRKINLSPSRDPNGYTVKKTDADEKNIIQIRYEKRTIKKYTLQFDSSKVSCKKGYSGTGEAVNPGIETKEGESYKFTAVLKTGEKVKHWLINGEARTYEKGETFSYTVRKNGIAEDAHIITISFEKQ